MMKARGGRVGRGALVAAAAAICVAATNKPPLHARKWLAITSRKDAILAAYDRFYRGDVAAEFVRGSRELGGLHTVEDLANWKVRIEEPVKKTYRGIDVY